MMLLSTETWLQFVAVAGESASVLFLMYGAWLVLLYHAKTSIDALAHVGVGEPA
jgi:hypothetical protein